jgi:hypothetical protein
VGPLGGICPEVLFSQAFPGKLAWQSDGALEQSRGHILINLHEDRPAACVSPCHPRYGEFDPDSAASILFEMKLPFGQAASGFTGVTDEELLARRKIFRFRNVRVTHFQ